MSGCSDATHLSIQLCSSSSDCWLAFLLKKKKGIYCCCVCLLCSVARLLTRDILPLCFSCDLFSLPVSHPKAVSHECGHKNERLIASIMFLGSLLLPMNLVKRYYKFWYWSVQK